MPIEPNDIHIWSAHLASAKHQEEAILSQDERARAERYVFPIHRQRFIAARCWLRKILGFYLNLAPQDIIFTYDKKDKPFLSVPNNTALQFNLSHSEDIAIYAITLNHAIGVDIEKIQEHYNDAVAKRFFSSQEYTALMQLSPQDRIIGFYRIWSRKEAIIKATGKGLSTPLSGFSVSAHDVDEIITLNKNEKWSLYPVFIQNDYQSAVATQQIVKKITYWFISDQGPVREKIITF